MGILLFEGINTISNSNVVGLGLSYYTQQLCSTWLFFILVFLILLPTVSHMPLQTHIPSLRNSSQPNQQFRLQTNWETLDRDLVWNRTYNFSPYDSGNTIVECQSGGFALFGETQDNKSDLLLIRVDSMGNILWNFSFGTSDNEFGADFVECFDGGFLLLGNRHSEMFLVRTNSYGSLIWNQSLYSRPMPSGISIIRCQTGGFAVLYSEYRIRTWLLRLDEQGIPVWNRTYNAQPFRGGDTFVECQDGGFAFIASAYPGLGNSGVVLLIRTNIIGDVLWIRNIIFGRYVSGYGLVECDDGGFAYTGTIHDWGILGDYLFLTRTDHMGVLIWNNTYGDGFGNSVLQMETGEFVITGFRVGVIASYDDVVFCVVNSSGYVLINWEIGGVYSQRGNSIIECRDGGFAIIGATYDEAYFSNVLLIRIPRVTSLDPFQRLQWFGAVIVLPILVSVIIVILTIWVFRSKKIHSHKKK